MRLFFITGRLFLALKLFFTKNNLLNKSPFFKLLIPIVIIAGIFLFITKSRADSSFDIPTFTDSRNDYKWWNNDYAYRRKIVPSQDIDQIVKLNHSQLVIDNKSSANASDLKIILNDEDSFEEVSIDITNPDQIETYISFVYRKNSGDVYLYYGNKSDLPEPNSRELKYSNVNQTAALSDEEVPELSILIQRKWNLKEKNSRMLLQVNDYGEVNNASYYYFIDDSKTALSLDIQNNIASIDFSNIEDGNHKLFVVRRSEGGTIRSNTTEFIASQPIYLSWTIDWEGIDPGKQNLESVASLADQYKIPLSHFFNPRTLINLKIPESRKKEILNWIKNRIENNGDEVDMLLHFQFDLVEEADVSAKFKETTWDNGLNGYDMPGTVYNYDEYLKILNWGKQKIIEAGLPEPKGYRAGGWFINEENLRAVKDSGFLYDSSAVKPIELGENKMMQDWQITNISQPYKISPTNKNLKAENKNALVEIPINGGDSYINSYEETLQNFTDNYSSNTYSNTSKLIVYSSSPEWIEAGKESLENLFATVSNFRYDIDRGPIKFVTLSDWYSNSVN